MLNKFKTAIAGSVIAVAMLSNAAHAETEVASAEAEIVAAVELTAFEPLNFGIIAVGAAGGTVTLDEANGTRTCSAALTCVGGSELGRFQVTNAGDGLTVNLTVDASTTLTGAGAPMTVLLAPSVASIVYDSSTPEDIFVGGELAVGTSQTAGLYSGTYNVTADYQ